MKIKAKKGPRITRTVMCNSRRSVMTDYTGCSYITAGKVYRADYVNDKMFYIVADNGSRAGCLMLSCAHLDGNNWRRVKV